MLSEGPRSPSLGVSDSSAGNVVWSNPGNIVSSNNVYASASGVTGQTTQRLRGYSFGFSIPSTANIVGILLEVECRYSSGSQPATDNEVRLRKGSAYSSANRASSTGWSTSDTYRSYGGQSDTWDEVWTPADINSPEFGGMIRANLFSGWQPQNVFVDHMRITVYYTLAGAMFFSTQII